METWVNSLLGVVLILMACGPSIVLISDANTAGRKLVAVVLLALSLLGYMGMQHSGSSVQAYAVEGVDY